MVRFLFINNTNAAINSSAQVFVCRAQRKSISITTFALYILYSIFGWVFGKLVDMEHGGCFIKGGRFGHANVYDVVKLKRYDKGVMCSRFVFLLRLSRFM